MNLRNSQLRVSNIYIYILFSYVVLVFTEIPPILFVVDARPRNGDSASSAASVLALANVCCC